jgi:hypothetical protein
VEVVGGAVLPVARAQEVEGAPVGRCSARDAAGGTGVWGDELHLEWIWRKIHTGTGTLRGVLRESVVWPREIRNSLGKLGGMHLLQGTITRRLGSLERQSLKVRYGNELEATAPSQMAIRLDRMDHMKNGDKSPFLTPMIRGGFILIVGYEYGGSFGG